MKKLSFLMTLSLLSSIAIYAQKDTSWRPQPDSVIRLIPYGEGRYSSYLYTIGGKLQTAEDVKIRLLSYTPSAAEFAQAKNHLTWAYVSFGGLAVSGIAATIEYANNNKHAGVKRQALSTAAPNLSTSSIAWPGRTFLRGSPPGSSFRPSLISLTPTNTANRH